MEYLSIVIAWSMLALAATLSPGPDTLLVASHAARNGRSAGLQAAAGIAAGGLWYKMLSGFGLLSLLVASPVLFAIVKTVGALYLAWLGIGLLRGAIWPKATDGSIPVELGHAPFRQAFVTNALNPKVALFYLAALPQFVGNGSDAPALGMVLIAIHYAIAGVWFSLLAMVTSKAEMLASRTNIWRWIEGALGAGFVALAGKLATDRN